MAAHYIYKTNSLTTAFAVVPTTSDINYSFITEEHIPPLSDGDKILIYRSEPILSINSCFNVKGSNDDDILLTKDFDITHGCDLEQVPHRLIDTIASSDDNVFIEVTKDEYDNIITTIFSSYCKDDSDQLVSIEGVDIKDYSLDEIGEKLGTMYHNAEDKTQVVSIYLFGIKYGYVITKNQFQPKRIIESSGIKSSYESELSKALRIYKYIKEGMYGLSFSENTQDSYIEETTTPISWEQKIYYGAPGTGKSNSTKKDTAGKRKTTITFHPDSDYSSFVGSYKPALCKCEADEGCDSSNLKNDSEILSYKFVPQAFAKAYVNAWKDISKPYYLVIEEINRGNCAQIFGDIFQLLDRDSDGYSEYIIDIDEDFKGYIEKELGGKGETDRVIGYEEKIREIALKNEVVIDDTFDYGKIIIPRNLNILATMNTSDQSLFPMDSAFKRRWDWMYVPIDLKDVGDVEIRVDGSIYLWSKFITIVNDKIFKVNDSEDKQLGPYFAKSTEVKNDDDTISRVITDEQFVSKVMFYLWFEVFKDEISNTIFFTEENKEDGSGLENKRFSFNKLFKTEGTIDSEKLKKFLKDSLGMEPEPSTPDQNTEEEQPIETIEE